MNYQFNSLHHFLRNAANNIKSPDSTFLLRKIEDNYTEIPYSTVLTNINSIAAYLFSSGLKKGDKVAIIMENCPEYLYFDQALMMLGMINVSIYPTLTEKEISYIIKDSASKAILVGSPFLFKKVSGIKEECPDLKFIFTAFSDIPEGKDEVITIKSIAEKGKEIYPSVKNEIEKIFESVSRNDLASLIYTSGTTGVPKGTMLTHNNFMSNAITAIQLVPEVDKNFRFLSFLPLCHVYERLATYYLSTYIGSEIAFAQSIDTIAKNITEVQPSIMATVPRLLERIEEKVRKNANATGGVKTKIFNWAIGVGEKVRIANEEKRNPNPLLKIQHGLAGKLVFSKIKEKLGGKMEMIISGGGALPQHVGEFFGNIGVKVLEGYGLTETSPFISVNEYNRQLFGTVGRIAPEQTVAIQNPDTKEILAIQTYESFDPKFESAEGEILVKGPNVMQGYWNKPEETAGVFDSEGWFHTGDVGRFHKGYLKITDRIKNMLVNSFGKNIYPTPVENMYLRSSKIEQIFIIGDKREYLTAIIVPSSEELKEKFGKTDSFFEEEDLFIRDQEIIDWVNEDIKQLGKNLAKFERIKNFLVKRKAFTVESGEFTPTQKTKRKVIEPRYKEEIDRMYEKETMD